MWRCDVHKRQRMRETAAIAQALIADDEKEETEEDAAMDPDDIQLQSA